MATEQEQRIIVAARSARNTLRDVGLCPIQRARWAEEELADALRALDASEKQLVTCSRCPECGQLVGEGKRFHNGEQVLEEYIPGYERPKSPPSPWERKRICSLSSCRICPYTEPAYRVKMGCRLHGGIIPSREEIEDAHAQADAYIEWEAEQMKDPEFRAACEKLEPEYQRARLLIRAELLAQEIAQLITQAQTLDRGGDD